MKEARWGWLLTIALALGLLAGAAGIAVAGMPQVPLGLSRPDPRSALPLGASAGERSDARIRALEARLEALEACEQGCGTDARLHRLRSAELVGLAKRAALEALEQHEFAARVEALERWKRDAVRALPPTDRARLQEAVLRVDAAAPGDPAPDAALALLEAELLGPQPF